MLNNMYIGQVQLSSSLSYPRHTLTHTRSECLFVETMSLGETMSMFMGGRVSLFSGERKS